MSKRPHVVDEVCFAKGHIVCTCGKVVKVTVEEPRKLSDEALYNAYSAHVRKPEAT